MNKSFVLKFTYSQKVGQGKLLQWEVKISGASFQRKILIYSLETKLTCKAINCLFLAEDWFQTGDILKLAPLISPMRPYMQTMTYTYLDLPGQATDVGGCVPSVAGGSRTRGGYHSKEAKQVRCVGISTVQWSPADMSDVGSP